MADFLVLDGTNRVHVLWHVHHDASRVIAQLARELEAMEESLRPSAMAVAFDSAAPTFREDLDRSYKGHRPETDPRLRATLDEAQHLVERSTYGCLAAPGFEADDIMATVAAAAVDRGDRAVIASPDKDLRQCLRAGAVTILRSYKVGAGRFRPTWLSYADHQREKGVTAERWIDYQCLVGDDHDGIVGAKSIGPKTACEWLSKASLDELLKNRWLVHMTERQWQGLLELGRRLSVVRQLVTMRTDVPGVTAWMARSEEPVHA